MKRNQVFIVIYIFVSLAAVGLLAGLLIKCQQDRAKEPLCLCFGPQAPALGGQRCVNSGKIRRAYNSGAFLPQFAAV